MVLNRYPRKERVAMENPAAVLAAVLAVVWFGWAILKFVKPVIEIKDNWINSKKRRKK